MSHNDLLEISASHRKIRGGDLIQNQTINEPHPRSGYYILLVIFLLYRRYICNPYFRKKSKIIVPIKGGIHVLSPILSTVDLPTVDDCPSISPVSSPTHSGSPSHTPVEQNMLLLSAPNPLILVPWTADVLELSPLRAFQMSSPPSSSPARIFSSSPLASSQPSIYAPTSEDSAKVLIVEGDR